MSARVSKILLALSLLVNAFVLAGFAYSTWIEPPLPPRYGPGQAGAPSGTRPNPLEALARDLDLDNSQRQAVQPVLDKYAARRQEMYGQIQKAREQILVELKKPELDQVRVDALVDEMAGVRTEQQKQSLRSISEMSQKLRPEQQEQLHKLLAERYAGGWLSSRSSGPGRGPGPGPNPGRPPQ